MSRSYSGAARGPGHRDAERRTCGHITGRAGMTTTEVLDRPDRERHEAVVRLTGIGLIPTWSAGTEQMCPAGPTQGHESQGKDKAE